MKVFYHTVYERFQYDCSSENHCILSRRCYTSCLLQYVWVILFQLTKTNICATRYWFLDHNLLYKQEKDLLFNLMSQHPPTSIAIDSLAFSLILALIVKNCLINFLQSFEIEFINLIYPIACYGYFSSFLSYGVWVFLIRL